MGNNIKLSSKLLIEVTGHIKAAKFMTAVASIHDII